MDVIDPRASTIFKQDFISGVVPDACGETGVEIGRGIRPSARVHHQISAGGDRASRWDDVGMAVLIGELPAGEIDATSTGVVQLHPLSARLVPYWIVDDFVYHYLR